MLGLDRWLDPHVEQYLLVDDDEYIVDEVHQHPMAIFWPTLRVVLGVIRLPRDVRSRRRSDGCSTLLGFG